MIQILAIREWVDHKTGKSKKAEVWFDRGFRAPDVESIFRSPDEWIKTLPKSDRYNLYYTVAECLEEPGRKLSAQHHIPFDIDGIDVPEDYESATDQFVVIAKVACQAIGVPFEKCGVLFSGNGIQIIVGTTFTISSSEHFDQERRHYAAVCSRIQIALGKSKIKGTVDRSVWSPARLLRYPNTLNKKPNKPERFGIILNSAIERVDYNLTVASGLPSVDTRDQISPDVLSSFPTPDVETIMSECQFMHYAATNPEKLSEPEWYAMLSVSGRFPDGRKVSHELSKGHPGYSYAETEDKITQAMAASGPRTCQDLDRLADKCRGCKYDGGKITSPILIEGPDHIKTKDTGFHFMSVIDGKPKILRPDIKGLQRFFEQQFPYVSLESSSLIYTWNGSFYEKMSNKKIEEFAEINFDPDPKENLRKEFLSKVNMFNLRRVEWFQESTTGKMNFLNGVVDIATRAVEPASKDYGFRSVLPCEYAPAAKCPVFLKFMGEVTEERQELIDVLQEFMGYIFASEDCRYEKALVLLGGGANGKSTFVEVIRKLTGKYGSSNLSFKALSNDQDRYLLEGKLVNIAEENSEDSFRDAELIKNLISGGYIKIKQLYAQPYEIKNSAKLVMLCNNAPRSNDHSHGFYRKLLLVPFTATFSDEKGNKDTQLGAKLAKELPGIFNWVIEGYERLVKNGKFSTGDVIAHAFENYTADINPIHQWFEEKCRVISGEGLPAVRAEMYDDFRSWCDQNGHSSNKYNSRKVFDFVRKRVAREVGKEPKDFRETVDGKRIWLLPGVTLVDKALH